MVLIEVSRVQPNGIIIPSFLFFFLFYTCVMLALSSTGWLAPDIQPHRVNSLPAKAGVLQSRCLRRENPGSSGHLLGLLHHDAPIHASVHRHTPDHGRLPRLPEQRRMQCLEHPLHHGLMADVHQIMAAAAGLASMQGHQSLYTP